MSRVVFLGTPETAVVILRALRESHDFEIAGVITQPDRPAGRGKRLQAPPVKQLALEWGIPIRQPSRIRGDSRSMRFLQQVRPDLMVVVAFGQILPEDFFSWPEWGTINVHTSLLPRYRGAAPVIRAVAAGETRTGVTIMKIDAGMDTGDILSTRETEILPDETAGELEERLAAIGAELLLEALPAYLAGELKPRPQDHSRASLAPLVRKEEACLDWREAATTLHNQIRAFNPRPGAVTGFRGEALKVWRTTAPRQGGSPAAPGTLLSSNSKRLTVACGQETELDLLELQPANRKRLTAQEFQNGFAPQMGEVFE